LHFLPENRHPELGSNNLDKMAEDKVETYCHYFRNIATINLSSSSSHFKMKARPVGSLLAFELLNSINKLNFETTIDF
jgi:hypothetical protein